MLYRSIGAPQLKRNTLGQNPSMSASIVTPFSAATNMHMAPVIGAVQYGTLVDRDHVATHLRWVIQVQYFSGQAVAMPRASTYSAVVLTEIVARRTQTAHAATAAVG